MKDLALEDADYIQGQIAAQNEAVSNAQANASSINATGTTSQVVGFNTSGQPTPLNVAGDSNGAGLSANGTTLQATFPQNLQTSGSPTFSALTITNGITTGSVTPGGGAAIKKAVTGTVSVDPASIAAQTRGSVSVTVTGCAVGDLLILEPPATLESGLAYAGCEITAASTVRIELANITGSAIDGASLTWKYRYFDLT